MTPKRIPNHSQAHQAFLAMLAQKRPQIYQAVLQRLKDRGLAGLGETVDTTVSEPGYFDKFMQTIQTIVPTYLGYQMSKDLYSLNLERAKQGLPPIDSASVAPQVQVGLSPQTQMLVFGGLGLLAVMLLSRRRR